MPPSAAQTRRSPTYLAKRRRARIALGACVVLLFLGYAYLSFLEAFLSPHVVASGDRLFLLYQAAKPHEGEAGFYLRERTPDGEWRPEKRFQGEARGAVAAGEDVWVFYRRTCSVYRSGKQVAAYDLGVPWDVQAVVDGREPPAPDAPRTFLAFAFDEKHTLCAAEIAGPRAGERQSELPGRVLAGTFPRPSSPKRLEAARHGDGVLLVWPRNAGDPNPAPLAQDVAGTDDPASPWSLQACLFDGERFQAAAPLPLGRTQSFSVFALDGVAALLTIPEGWKDGPRIRLECRRFGTSGWQPPTDLRMDDSRWFGRRVLEVSACTSGGRTHLVISRASGLELGAADAAPLLRGEAATFPTPQPVSPAGSFGRPEVLAWLMTLLFVALSMVFLGVSLLSERFRPSVLPPPDAPPLVPAPWLARGLAYFLDALTLMPVWVAVPWLSGFSPQDLAGADGAPLLFVTVLTNLTIMTYAAVCEGLWGRTLGKRVFGLWVLTEEGGRIGWRHAVLRNLVRPIDGVGPQCLIGLLFILSTRQGQRLGDILGRTVVARHGPRWYA